MQPPQERQKDYLDHTMTHSIVLLAVCDAKMKFTHVSTGFPGSIHDQRCLDLSHRLSDARKNTPNEFFPKHEFHLAGDSGFKLHTTFLVPFKDYGNLSRKQSMYNMKLSKSRVVVENSFGMLKERCCCLKLLEVDIHNVTPIVVACCVIYNIAFMFPDKLCLPELLAASGDGGEAIEDPHPNAAQKRNSVCNVFS